MVKNARIRAALCLSTLLIAAPALAHPHAWIAMRTKLIVDSSGLITGFEQQWNFDEGYAETALDGLDADGNGVYAQAEIDPLTQENIKSLEEYDYFSVVRQNGEKQTIGKVVKSIQTYENKQLSLIFEIPLAKSLDPNAGEIQIKVYDPDFFIAYDYTPENPFSVQGQLDNGCSIDLKPLPADEEMEQTRDFLAEKGKDWKPETQEDFGAVFARPLVVNCDQKTAVVADSNQAQTPKIDRSKLLVQPRDTTADTAGFLENPVVWIQNKQRSFYSAMNASLNQMQSSNSATSTLLGLSFLYGVFHAAGPGHGKAIISSWLVATESDLRRGIIVSFLSALFQAITAILIVTALFLLVASAGSVARDVAGWMESASYALIATMGIYLTWSVFGKSNHHNHDHAHHYNEHRHDDHAAHVHMPAATDLRKDWSLWRAVTMAFSIGLRPCTGAILVLIFANRVGLYGEGVAATLVMGLGVFLTMSVIAAITVYARDYALSLARHDNRTATRIVLLVKGLAGIAMACFGLLLFWSSIGTGIASV